MAFQQYDLGYRKRGDLVEVNLSGNAANVRLMNSSNLNAYKSGRSYRYDGGVMTRRTGCLSIPNSGFWHLVVDLDGLRGTTRSSVQVISGR